MAFKTVNLIAVGCFLPRYTSSSMPTPCGRIINMNNDQLLDYCLSKPGAHQSNENLWQANQIKVAGVMFAMLRDKEGHPAISLKTSHQTAASLRHQHPEILPSDCLNKAHWNCVLLDGNLPDSQFYNLIDSSYQLVLEGLPEEKRQEIGD
jgi:predicted DNA-binding protein (MmcQ/YjbR family)